MKLSIIVVFYNMTREAQNTVQSLSVPYQQQVNESDYEVICVDNASSELLRLDIETFKGSNIRLIRHETCSVSPVEAVNLGVKMSTGDNVAIIVDGARMASPKLIYWTLQALDGKAKPLVGCLAFHLGPDVQNVSMLSGYNQKTEDELLNSIDWKNNGYALFSISVLAQSSKCGFFGGIPPELSWLCVSRDLWNEFGGYDTAFVSPGGGLVNQDAVLRVLAIPNIQITMILGEGVFHQYHGGVATNVPTEEHPFQRFNQEYERIRGKAYRWTGSKHNVEYIGHWPEQARRFISVKKSREKDCKGAVRLNRTSF